MPIEEEPQVDRDVDSGRRKLTAVRLQIEHLEERRTSIGTSIANLQKLQDECDARVLELGFMESGLIVEYPELMGQDSTDTEANDPAHP